MFGLYTFESFESLPPAAQQSASSFAKPATSSEDTLGGIGTRACLPGLKPKLESVQAAVKSIIPYVALAMSMASILLNIVLYSWMRPVAESDKDVEEEGDVEQSEDGDEVAENTDQPDKAEADAGQAGVDDSQEAG